MSDYTDHSYLAGFRPSASSQSHGELHQGAAPLVGQELSDKFDTIVFCAEEYQPRNNWNVECLYCPLDDATPTVTEVTHAKATGKRVADRVRSGKRVLVTCAQGRNRSGLVNGYALQFLGETPPASVQLIQRLRRNALTNDAFVNALLRGPQSVDVLARAFARV